MRTSFHSKSLSLIFALALLSSAVQAAEYYVVVGAFAQESNARRFTTTVRNFFKEVSYRFSADKSLYYVHVMHTGRKEDARNWSLYLRNEKGFKDAWVLAVPEESAYTPRVADGAHAPRYHAEFNPHTGNASLANKPVMASYSSQVSDEPIVRNSTAQEAEASSLAVRGHGSFDVATAASARNLNAAWTMEGGFGFIKNIKNVHQFKSLSDASSKLFTFVVEDPDGNSVPAEVMLVNFEKVKKIASFQTGEHVAIKGVKANQMVTFVCDMLGYSQETRMFNMDHLSRGRDITKNEDGVWEVKIKLKPMELNDLAFMNKTLFYKDAAVLEPKSQQEMDELVSIMKSNPGYKIVLHSHCNPGTKRDLKLPSDNNYFDLESSVEKSGSDKLLTKKRAEVLRDYLVNHGIDKKRIGIVAWGSMELIVKSTSEDAEINERIEIELVEI